MPCTKIILAGLPIVLLVGCSSSQAKPPSIATTHLDASGSGGDPTLPTITKSFTTGKSWDLISTWDCTQARLPGVQIEVFDAQDKQPDFDVPTPDDGFVLTGTKVQHEQKAGSFYLSVGTECTWRIRVVPT